MSATQLGIVTARIQECHAQLCEQRIKVISLADLVRRTSAAYYTMCNMDGSATPESELMLAMLEFQRRGLLQFDPSAMDHLSNDYVQSLKMLKQVVDNAVDICDRLVTLTSAQRTLQQQQQQPVLTPVVDMPVPPLPVKPPMPPPPLPPVYPSLDEALEAELHEESWRRHL